MQKKNETVSGLARKSGVSRDALHDWLAGKQPRNLSQLRTVAQALDTNIDNLCFGEGIENIKEKSSDISALLGNEWVSGVFEIKFRRVTK